MQIKADVYPKIKFTFGILVILGQRESIRVYD